MRHMLFSQVCTYGVGISAIYRVLCERSAKQYQQIVQEKIRKKLYVKLVAILENERLLASEISKFTKIRKFQKNLFANLRLLND